MTGFVGAAALGVVWGWLSAEWVRGSRRTLAALGLITVGLAVETAAFAGAAALGFFFVAAVIGSGLCLAWRRSLSARAGQVVAERP